MTKNWKITSLILALVLALTLGLTALAESPADNTATDTAKSAIEEAQAAADASQAESTALNEALEAYGKAKAEDRKLKMLTSLKEELDGYVAAGSLTQEQADLVLKYYAEQLTNQQNGAGFGKGGRMKNGVTNDFGGKGGKGGRGGHGRFGQQQNETQKNAAPEPNVTPEASGT